MHKDPFLPCSRYSQVQLINCVHETTDELAADPIANSFKTTCKSFGNSIPSINDYLDEEETNQIRQLHANLFMQSK